MLDLIDNSSIPLEYFFILYSYFVEKIAKLWFVFVLCSEKQLTPYVSVLYNLLQTSHNLHHIFTQYNFQKRFLNSCFTNTT